MLKLDIPQALIISSLNIDNNMSYKCASHTCFREFFKWVVSRYI
jgi:hypothetical protein